MHPSVEALLRFFNYTHLPANLREVSEPFHRLAHEIAKDTPDNAEKTAGLRKLLEAKDCVVRAHLPPQKED